MASSSIKHRGAAQIHALDDDLILLRQVDFKQLGSNVVDMLRNTDIRPGEKEGDQAWFLDGYITCNHPRDYQMSVELLGATTGYGIARTDTGEVLAEFEQNAYSKAAKVADRAHNAKTTVNILLDEEDEEPASE